MRSHTTSVLSIERLANYDIWFDLCVDPIPSEQATA